MRLTVLSTLLLPALLASASVLSPAVPVTPRDAAPSPTRQHLAQTTAPSSAPAAVTAAPELVGSPKADLGPREIITNPVPAPAPSQYPTVTTAWIETVLPGGKITTWVQVVYTQTFAAVPDQLPSPASGNVGLGTLTGTVGAVRTGESRKYSGAGAGRGMGRGARWGAVVVAGVGLVVLGIL
ncbi:hypothetical protein LTR50_004055 [Elasticomyces elasticus]|nr:hypothetical protein LTR50_004055 [Elasticomyces elasticus]